MRTYTAPRHNYWTYNIKANQIEEEPMTFEIRLLFLRSHLKVKMTVSRRLRRKVVWSTSKHKEMHSSFCCPVMISKWHLISVRNYSSASLCLWKLRDPIRCEHFLFRGRLSPPPANLKNGTNLLSVYWKSQFGFTRKKTVSFHGLFGT